jgi:hypothetical protein
LKPKKTTAKKNVRGSLPIYYLCGICYLRMFKYNVHNVFSSLPHKNDEYIDLRNKRIVLNIVIFAPLLYI